MKRAKRIQHNAQRDGRFRRRRGYGGQASSAVAEDVINPARLSSGR